MIKFNGENILVTGASDGLGKAICLLLNSLGANVIGIARNESKLEQLKKEIEFKEFINKSEFARICLTSTFDIDINWLKGKPSL